MERDQVVVTRKATPFLTQHNAGNEGGTQNEPHGPWKQNYTMSGPGKSTEARTPCVSRRQGEVRSRRARYCTHRYAHLQGTRQEHSCQQRASHRRANVTQNG